VSTTKLGIGGHFDDGLQILGRSFQANGSISAATGADQRWLSEQLATAAWCLTAAQEQLDLTPAMASDYPRKFCAYLQANILYMSVMAWSIRQGQESVALPSPSV
jgi:hypothetical protein